MTAFHRCPTCTKKGAYIKSHKFPSGDWWHCRYCAWSVHTDEVFDFRSGLWAWDLDPAGRPGS